jgi:hypothetical protein
MDPLVEVRPLVGKALDGTFRMGWHTQFQPVEDDSAIDRFSAPVYIVRFAWIQ